MTGVGWREKKAYDIGEREAGWLKAVNPGAAARALLHDYQCPDGLGNMLLTLPLGFQK